MATMIDSNTATRLISGSSASASVRDVTPVSAKQMELQEKLAKALNAIAQDTASEEERLHVIRLQNQQLLKRAVAASRTGNKELVEHIRMQVKANHEQLKFVDATHKMEKARVVAVQKYQEELAEVNRMMEHGETIDENRLLNLKTQAELLDKQEQAIRIRSLAEAKALRDGKDMVSVQSEIAEAMTRQADAGRTGNTYAEKMNEQLKNLRENSRKFGFEIDGLSKKQSLAVHFLVKASEFASYAAAWSLAKKSLSGFASAADSVTEASYRTGESLSRADHGVGNYVKRSLRMVELNTDIGLSFARMGLDAKDAEDMIPQMLSKNGTAMLAFKNKNNGALEDMAKSAGAFARQSGLSVEEAVDLQAELMEHKQMSTDQADDAMRSIVGSFKGVNDALTDAGFKGALLNVGEMSGLVAEAAKNSESASFSTEAYAKSLAKAAGAARSFGMSEKSSKEFAKKYSDAASSDDGYAKLKRGEALEQTLTSKYGSLAKSGDTKGLIAALTASTAQGGEGLAIETAEQVASALQAKAQGKGGPMFASRLATMLKDTEVNKHAFDTIIYKYIESKHLDPNDGTAIQQLSSDALLLNMLGGLDMDSAESSKMIQGVWHQYQVDKGVRSPMAPKSGGLDNNKMEEAQAKAKAEADAAGTGANALADWNNAKGYVGTIAANPITSAVGAAAAISTAGFMAKMGSGAASHILGRFGGNAIPGALPGAVPGAVDAAGNATTRAATNEVAEQGGESFAKRMLMLAAKHNKKLGFAATLLGLGGVAATAKVMTSSDAKKNADVPDDPNIAVGADGQMTKAGRDAQLAKLGYNDVTAPSGAPALANTPTWQTPSTASTLFSTGVNGVIDYGINKAAPYAAKTGKAVLGKVAPELSAKLAAKAAAKAAATTAAKTGARAIPILGALISSGITAATTEGPMGRKLFAGGGDLIGTLLGQAATGGFGGGIVGGMAGQAGGTLAYDKFFGGDNNSANAIPAVVEANKQVAMQQQLQPDVQRAMQMATGGNGGFGVGAFGPLKTDGSMELKLSIPGAATFVRQAMSYNQSMQSQYSGAKI